MKRFHIFTLFLFLNSFFLFAEVENISVSNNLIFTPDTSLVEELVPKDLGLTLDDFSIEENQTASLERSGENKFSVGILMNIKRSAYYGAESDFEAYPLIEVKYDKFFLKPANLEAVMGYTGGYSFYSDGQFVVSGIAEYHLADLNAKKLEYPYSNFIESKKSEFYFGVSGKFIPESNPEFMLGADISKNFFNSGGFKIRVYGERYISFTSDFYIIPSISYVFLDKDYVNYYYSVPTNKYGIDAYEDVSGNKFGAHLDMLYKLGENVSFRSMSSVEVLSNEIALSPIVSNRFNLNIGVGIMFDF